MKKKIPKKLSLRKITITNLSPASQQRINGGIDIGFTFNPNSCVVYCEPYTLAVSCRITACLCTMTPSCRYTACDVCDLSRVINC
ncbi:class I lanthipeptide [Chitinophaga sp.]|uniref:class I lanthipeptide n=1 Tax=Chitinophaga sp. TaxID=1869181 RepID=UPI0039C899E2